MTKLFKLTDQNCETYNHTKWGEGVTHKTKGYGEMCGPGWLHAYTSPELAVLLNPIHANFSNPILWECEGVVEKTDNGLKVGTTQLTTIKRIILPEVTTIQRVAFGILCSQTVYSNPQFNRWAKDWLTGKDRSAQAAQAASWAASWATSEAATRAAAEAAQAAQAASWATSEAATRAASRAASWAASQAASWAASWAARAARAASRATSWATSEAASEAASWAAQAASEAANSIDLDHWAKQALLIK